MASTLIHSLIFNKNKRPQDLALIFKKNSPHQNPWIRMSWNELFQEVEAFAHFLKKQGVRKKSRVGILSTTRMEWIVADLAIMSLGALTVALHTGPRESDLLSLIKKTKIHFLILENPQWITQPTELKMKLSLDENSWSSAMCWGHQQRRKDPQWFQKKIDHIDTSDEATVVFSSGSTGEPRGILLSHSQIMSEVSDLFTALETSPKDTALCLLPLSHILGRAESWGAVFCGFTLVLVPDNEILFDCWREMKPTFIVGVPRIFEKIRDRMQTLIEANPLRHLIYNKLDSLNSPTRTHKISHWIKQKTLWGPITQLLGSPLKFALSGGAPLNRELAHFFHQIGILILEGYGLTETTGAVTLNTPLNYRLGTVGKPLKDVQIKLADDGEILIKSSKVMLGYLDEIHHSTNSPIETKAKTKDETFTEDGFFKSGDIGQWTSDGYLTITDRKKELIKTSNGKFVSPLKIEALLKQNSLIDQALVYGEKRNFIVALITIKRSTQEIPHLRSIVQQIVADTNARLSPYEAIKNFVLLPQEWTVEGGELTPQFKMKRKFCEQKYQKYIDQLYEFT